MALDGCSQESVRVGVWRKVKRRLLVQQVVCGAASSKPRCCCREVPMRSLLSAEEALWKGCSLATRRCFRAIPFIYMGTGEDWLEREAGRRKM